MEAVALNRLFKNCESYNRNENTTCTSDLYTSTKVSDILPSKDEDELMDRINESFEGLKIQSCIESNRGKGEHLVGKINSLITSLHTVIVKPFSSDVLLYVGTPLFLICSDFPNGKAKYTLLGYVDDIFGSVNEPMYSVAMKCDQTDVLNTDAEVYYFPNHPNTLHMNVHYIVDKMSNIGKYKIKTKHAKV